MGAAIVLPSTMALNYVRRDWPHNNHATTCDEITHRGTTAVILGAASTAALGECLYFGTYWVIEKIRGEGDIGLNVGTIEEQLWRSFQVNLKNAFIGGVQNLFRQRVTAHL